MPFTRARVSGETPYAFPIRYRLSPRPTRWRTPAGPAHAARQATATTTPLLPRRPAAPEAERLAHQGDHVGLGDRLSLADRERRVVVGAFPQRGLDEEVARDAPHRRQHRRVVEVAALELLRDHPRAGLLEVDHTQLW